MVNKDTQIDIQTIFGKFNCQFISNFPEKGYTVIVPKLKGVVTFGDNKMEAKNMVKEAIELHCECLLQEGFAEIKVSRYIQNDKYLVTV